MTARETLIQIYRDWFNNYISLEVFAEHNGLTVQQAEQLVSLGRQVIESPHPES